MIKDFLKHLFPRIIHKKNLKFTYTFCLGGLAFSSFILLVISGLLLIFYYQPSVENAYESTKLLSEQVSFGHWVRSLHRNSSHALIVLLCLHFLRVVLTGAFRPPREMNWVLGLGLFSLCVFEAYLGNLLPMDQHSYWATVTGMEILKLLPGGEFLVHFLVPDAIGQGLSLLRFYILHILVVPMTILFLSFLHFYLIRKNKGLLPYL